MLTLDNVKNYVRATDEDDTLLNTLMQAAESYLENAIDNYAVKYATGGSNWQAKADFAKMQIIACWYEFREACDDIPATARLAIVQLDLSEVVPLNNNSNGNNNGNSNGN